MFALFQTPVFSDAFHSTTRETKEENEARRQQVLLFFRQAWGCREHEVVRAETPARRPAAAAAPLRYVLVPSLFPAKKPCMGPAYPQEGVLDSESEYLLA